MSQYDETSIFTPERLDHIRLRPTAYFPSTGIEGLIHQALELITNSIDEIALMPELAGKVIVLLCIDTARHTYQLVVKDTGRGLPIGRLLDSYTKLLTSGKFNTNAYEHSGGLFGVGAKASAGAARHFKPITHRPEASASIYVHEGKTDELVELLETPPARTGTTVLYEPDPLIFTSDIPTFSEEGQAHLLLLIQKYCFFRRMSVEFRVHPLGLPETIWTQSIQTTEAILDNYLAASRVVFSEETFDRLQWIRNYFAVQRPFAAQHILRDSFITRTASRGDITVQYEARLYYVKFDQVGGRFGMVNNVAIDDVKSTHFLTLMDTIKKQMSGLIKDPMVRKFFLEQYRLPLYVAVDVKFPGAEFAGTTKHAFLSKEFRKIYEPSLSRQLETAEGQVFLATVYEDLASDIDSRYMMEMTGTSKVKNTNRLFEELNYPKKLVDCSTTDRQIAELFLVEGDSAGGGSEGRDSVTQAVYNLRGKPFNGITSKDKIRQSAIAIRKDKIYEDIITMLRLNPSKFDKATLNFGSVLIMTDADNE